MVLKIPPPIRYLRQGYDAESCWLAIANKLNEKKRQCERLLFTAEITVADCKLRFGILKRSYQRLCSNFSENYENDLLQWRHYEKFTKILYHDPAPAPASVPAPDSVDLRNDLRSLRNDLSIRFDELSEMLHQTLNRNDRENADQMQDDSDDTEAQPEPSFEFLNDLLYNE